MFMKYFFPSSHCIKYNLKACKYNLKADNHELGQNALFLVIGFGVK